MDRVAQRGGVTRRDEEALHIGLDERAQVGRPPAHDRQPHPEGLGDRHAVGLGAAGAHEHVGCSVQRGQGGRVDGPVDDRAPAHAGALEPRRHGRPVARVRVGPTDEMERDVVVWQSGDRVDQLDEALVRQPIGDRDHAEPALVAEWGTGAGEREVAAGRDHLHRCDPVVAEGTGQDRAGRDHEVAASVGREVEDAARPTTPARTVDPARHLMDERDHGGPPTAAERVDELPRREAVDHDDIGGRQPDVGGRRGPHGDPMRRRCREQVLVVPVPSRGAGSRARCQQHGDDARVGCADVRPAGPSSHRTRPGSRRSARGSGPLRTLRGPPRSVDGTSGRRPRR